MDEGWDMQKIYKDASKKTSFPYLPTTWPRGSCFLTQFQYSLVAQVENRGQERAPLAFPGSPSPGEWSGMNRASGTQEWDPSGTHAIPIHLGRWTAKGTYSHHPWKERKMIRTKPPWLKKNRDSTTQNSEETKSIACSTILSLIPAIPSNL